MVDEATLLLRLKEKQKNAIDEAVEIYTPYLSTVLYNLAGASLPSWDLEEIVSDVFVALWKNADYIDLSKGTMRSYLAATARNLALKRLSRKKECAPLDEAHLPPEQGFTEEASDAEALWQAVMSLGEPDNEIFLRYYRYGEKLREISNATGLHLSTIKSKLSRGKQKLKKILSNAEESL